MCSSCCAVIYVDRQPFIFPCTTDQKQQSSEEPLSTNKNSKEVVTDRNLRLIAGVYKRIDKVYLHNLNLPFTNFIISYS